MLQLVACTGYPRPATQPPARAKEGTLAENGLINDTRGTRASTAGVAAGLTTPQLGCRSPSRWPSSSIRASTCSAGRAQGRAQGSAGRQTGKRMREESKEAGDKAGRAPDWHVMLGQKQKLR